MKTLLILASSALVASGAHGQILLIDQKVDLPVPDGDSSGRLSAVTVAGASGTLGTLRVSLELAGIGPDGGVNGDIYAYLQHGTGFAVLLNRPGRRSGNLSGYADNGLSVTFADAAPFDVHDYRVGLNGDHAIGLPGALTGVWQPDARNTDPGTTVAYEMIPRTAGLASFSGLDPNGEWDLHVFDLESGGEFQLKSWSVEFSSVPEPGFASVLTAGVLASFGIWRRCRSLGPVNETGPDPRRGQQNVV